MADRQLDAVRFAFEASFARMCAAGSADELAAELSNLLHQVYRLRELCLERLGGPAYYGLAGQSVDLRAAEGASWVRNFDTHQLFATAAAGDVYSGFYTSLYAVLVWLPLAELPSQADKQHQRHSHYEAELAGRPVLDTLRGAFDALAGLL